MEKNPELDIIVPAKNEAENLPGLVKRIAAACDVKDIHYRIVVVNDRSTDKTESVARNLALSYPVVVHNKEGKPGKGYAILEGAARGNAPFVAMIDADQQYPPESLPEMLDLAKKHGMVVANRASSHKSKIRALVSKANRFVTGKMLLGFSCDTQSGLKVFNREIITHIHESQVTAWGVDVPLLHTAQELGYTISTVDIIFADRAGGQSKVRVLKTSWQIISGALRTKFSKRKMYLINPDGESSMGAGIVYKRKRFITHSQLPHHKSAIQVVTPIQKYVLIGILALIGVGLIINTHLTALIIIAAMTAVYFADSVFSLFIVGKSLTFPPEVTFDQETISKINDNNLPVYTILCPLYKEAKVLPHFVHNISKLDWPKSKMEVLMLLEADDTETISAAESMHLPDFIKVVIVPHSFPKTKPKACNYGLQIATGEYVVIYDAEDKPDADQLKKAYLGFQQLPDHVACLQAKLNYFNPKQNLLTRLFTAEYSLWFDVVLPGYQSLNTTIPLGGTSNHFRTPVLRELQGWDAFNVTEDCDLGARLFKEGYRTAIVDSTTLEEANSKWGNWLRQRSRWIKGYLQTLLVHNRQPASFLKTHKLHALIFQLVVGGKIIFTVINPFLWITTIAYFVAYKYVGPTIESLYPPIIFYMAGISAVFGNFLYLYYYMIGCAKRRQWGLVKYAFLIPVYWCAVSLAAFKAVWQLITKPHFWEKTNHRLHLQKPTNPKPPGETGNAKRLISDISNLFDESPVTTDAGHKLRVLIFNWRDNSHKWAGGAEVYVTELAKRWVSQGHNVTIFCGNDNTQPNESIVDGVKIIRRGGTYLIYIWAFIYYIFKFRKHVDVVIDSENGLPFFTPLYVRVAKFLLIHHVHQSALIYSGHLKFPLTEIAMFLERRVMPLVYRNEQIITVSESSKKDIAKIGMAEENITIINPGIVIEDWKPVKKTAYPSFIYLGRIRPYKNLDIAIEGFSEVVKTYPEAKLTIAGWGENIDSLKKQVKSLHLQNQVVFTGKVKEEDKSKLLGQSWAMIQPSSFEGWGITVIEANACGTPVIASNVIGLRDSVVDQKTGLLVEEKNADEFANAMIELIENPSKRARMEKEAREWAKKFDWDHLAAKLISTISTAVENHNLFSPVIPAFSQN